MRVADAPLRNLLLASLPLEELWRVRPHLEPVHLDHREELFERNATIRHVYFPETAIISLVTTLSDGAPIEVGTAGYEGIAGLFVFLAEGIFSSRALTQVAGLAWRMDVDSFSRLSSAPGPFRRVLLHYTQAFLTQVTQTAFCNAAHLVAQRCARWLLVTHDRVEADEFPLTSEFLALMLGVRETGVTGAMRALQDAGLVTYSHERVALVNRAKLERASCECYRVVRAHFERLLPACDPAFGFAPGSTHLRPGTPAAV